MIASFLLSAALVSANTPITTAAGLNDFGEDTTRRYTPFCITGTVQAINAPADYYLIVSDATGWTDIRNETKYRPALGEIVVLNGRAHMSVQQETYVTAQEVRSVGKGTVEPTLTLPLNRIIDEKNHLHPVITEGIVMDSFPDEIDSRNWFLILKDDDDILPIAIHVKPTTDQDLERLRDARIRVKGRFMRTVSGSRKFSGPFISVDDRSNITVIDPALENPFDAPALEKSIYRSPKEIAKRGKRSVVGNVLAVWGENKLMLRAADGRIVNVTLAHGQFLPRPGDTITATGYPETDLFRVNLTRAIARKEPNFPEPQNEQMFTDLKSAYSGNGLQNSIDPDGHGRLICIRGTVQSVPSPGSTERRLLLVCGPYKLPVDLGPDPEAGKDIAIGTELEVTGRCRLEIDSWNPGDIVPRIKGLVAVIRTPADLRVIAGPPWWTPQKLLYVIAALILALIGIWIRNIILKRMGAVKVAERTRLAVELHDSLSQTLAGVACQLAAGAKTMDSNPETAKRCIATADKMLQSCRTELKECLFDLRSDTLEETDLSAAIRRTLDQLDGNAAIAVRFNVPRERLEDTVVHAILAIIRELTGNAIRHGKATEIKIAGAIEDDRILFSVRDNGQGFDPDHCNGPLQGHFGLEGIRNRIEKFNGTFNITSEPGSGTKATVSIAIGK